jgi:uncharacterized membrane protein YhiD involved in acid resistance
MSGEITAALIGAAVVLLIPIVAIMVQLGRVLERIDYLQRFVREDFVQVQIKVNSNTEDIARILTKIAVLNTRLRIRDEDDEQDRDDKHDRDKADRVDRIETEKAHANIHAA